MGNILDVSDFQIRKCINRLRQLDKGIKEDEKQKEQEQEKKKKLETRKTRWRTLQ